MAVLVALEFSSDSEYKHGLQIAAYEYDVREESMRYCILRERGYEALVLRNAKIPFIAFQKDTGNIIDSNVDVDSLRNTGIKLMIRGRSKNIHIDGFDPFLDKQDSVDVERWPEKIRSPEKYLKRNVSYVPKSEFMSALFADKIDFPLFVKGSDKGVSNEASLRHVFSTAEDLKAMFVSARDVIEAGRYVEDDVDWLLKFQYEDWFCPYRDSMIKGKTEYSPLKFDFITSDIMNIDVDSQSDNGKKEYRCYIFNGKLCSASRYADYDEIAVPESVRSFARDFAQDHANVFPIAYVLDVCESDKGLQVIELNQFEYSGRYIGNKPLPMYKAMNEHFNAGKSLSIIKPLPLPSQPEKVKEVDFIFDFKDSFESLGP